MKVVIAGYEAIVAPHPEARQQEFDELKASRDRGPLESDIKAATNECSGQ